MLTYHKPKSAVLPKGDYEVTVIRAREMKSRQGNVMIELVLSAGALARPFFEYLPLVEGSDWKVRDFFVAMGQEAIDGVEIVAADYIGRTARVRVGIEVFEGNEKNKITKWLSPVPAVTQPAAFAGSPAQTQNKSARQEIAVIEANSSAQSETRATSLPADGVLSLGGTKLK